MVRYYSDGSTKKSTDLRLDATGTSNMIKNHYKWLRLIKHHQAAKYRRFYMNYHHVTGCIVNIQIQFSWYHVSSRISNAAGEVPKFLARPGQSCQQSHASPMRSACGTIEPSMGYGTKTVEIPGEILWNSGWFNGISIDGIQWTVDSSWLGEFFGSDKTLKAQGEPFHNLVW